LVVGGWWLAVGGWRLAVGGWWLAVGGWRLVVGGWWLVVGGWWLVAGGWWLVVGGYGSHPPFIPPHFAHEASQNEGGNGKGLFSCKEGGGAAGVPEENPAGKRALVQPV
jgi:hypothetical protein